MEQRLELELGRDSIGVSGGSFISLETVLGVRLGCRLQLQGFNIHSPSEPSTQTQSQTASSLHSALNSENPQLHAKKPQIPDPRFLGLNPDPTLIQ